MRNIVLCIFILFAVPVFAQDAAVSGTSVYAPYRSFLAKPDLAFLETLNDSRVVSVSTPNVFFNKSYLIGKNGDALSNGFMPSSHFSPNDNLIVFSGQNIRQRDSFNPYGAYDMTSMIILSTFNTFISKIKIRRR